MSCSMTIMIHSFMKAYNVLFLIIFLILCISCESQNEELPDIEKLGFHEGSKSVDFSKLSDNLEIIPLNIPDTVALGRIHSIRYYGDYLLLHDKDYAQALYIFNKDGDYINRLRRIGSGPGEYATFESYIINEDILTIYDRRLLQGVKYQLPHLNYLETIETNGYFRGDLLNWHTLDYAIGLSDDYVEEGLYEGIVFLGENYHSIHNIEKPPGVIEASERGNLSNIGNDIFYAEPFSEVIYMMDSMEFVPLYRIDFGKNGLPRKAELLEEAEDFYKILSSRDYAFAVHNFNMQDSVVSFNFYWRTIDEIRMGIYDLRKNEGTIINDIGPLKDYLTWPLSISDGYNLSILYPDEYDGEVLSHMGLSTEEILNIDYSQPLLLRYSINKFPDQ